LTHPILARLASADAGERRAACSAAALDPAAILLADALGEALGDPDAEVASAAADALVHIGRAGGDVAPVLRRALHGPDPIRRWRAAFASARLGPPGPRLLPALVEALASEDGHVRWAASRLLVEAGRSHGEVLTLLLGLARSDPTPVVRRMAAHGLRALAPDTREAAETLVAVSRDEDLHVRRAAIAALAALRDPPREVFDRLIEALVGDDDGATRRIGAVALGELGAAHPRSLPEGAVEALRRERDGAPDADLRRGAERALARIASRGGP